ncbi:hypothetical protein [Litorisediminicola beolgyonensis]|uniref:Tetratricopeptide repeat protein n=1 Tax=Litorisediminicola beolgyonensis TaxID=1173614 RepID=A0ABW3ZGS0_9RHOB
MVYSLLLIAAGAPALVFGMDPPDAADLGARAELAWPGTGSVDRAPERVAEAPPPEKVAPAEPRRPLGPLPALRLPEIADEPFFETRTRFLGALAADQIPHEETFLSLAALHLAHGFLPEARAYLDAAYAPEADARAAALDIAIGVFEMEGAARQSSPPPPMPETWPDAPLYDALARLFVGAYDVPGFAAALERLDSLPVPLLSRALPVFFSHAVEIEEWRTARDLAMRFADVPGLSDAPVYHYLLGRVAEAGGEDVAALDSYRRAAEGRDRAAQEARLAIVALGQRTGTLTAEDAVELLEVARWMWRGDPLEIVLLERLVAALVETGDRVRALEILADLSETQIDPTVAAAAVEQADSLLDAFYSAGAKGDLPLSAFVDGHDRLTLDYRFAPGFDRYTERLANRLLELGATTAAAERFGEIRDHIAVAHDLGLASIAPERRDSLRLDEAEALLAGGQDSRAAEILSAALTSENRDLAARAAVLRAQAFQATGLTDELLSLTPETPSARVLALKAEALYARGDWEAAMLAYETLRAEGREAFGEAEAARLLLAAHRAGRGDDVVRLAAELPELAEVPHWAGLASEIGATRPDLLPLRRNAIEAEMDEAERSLNRLNELGQEETQG